ncbi:8334_t:CDS:2, partial [Scutellospora calospora]
VNIATTINNLLVEFNLTNKVLALTTDNVLAILVCGKILADTTYHSLEVIEQEIAIRMQTALRRLAVNYYDIQKLMPTTKIWEKIKEILILMKLLEKATKLLSTSLYLTIADI